MKREFITRRAAVPAKALTPGARPAPKRVSREDLERAAAQKSADATRLDPKFWPKEIGGPEGPEPTRYGDWERKGICSDF
ncbi:MAG: succinate dehydrogenase assembly factor 4 [Pseudomonadota bacterium]